MHREHWKRRGGNNGEASSNVKTFSSKRRGAHSRNDHGDSRTVQSKNRKDDAHRRPDRRDRHNESTRTSLVNTLDRQEICLHYFRHGYCSYIRTCVQCHNLTRVSTVTDAHNKPITTGYMRKCDDKDDYEMYTASKDSIIKKWAVNKEDDPFVKAASPGTDIDYGLTSLTSIPLPSVATAICFDEAAAIFGLLSGEVTVAENRGNGKVSFQAHDKEVSAALLANGVLYTADITGELKCWVPKNEADNSIKFECMKTLKLGMMVTKLSSFNTSSNFVIAGASMRVGLVDISLGGWVKHYEVKSLKSFCMEILRYDTNIITVFSDGTVFTLAGSDFSEISSYKMDYKSFTVCAAVSTIGNNPVLITGDNEGVIRIIDLHQNCALIGSREIAQEQIRCIFASNDFLVVAMSSGTLSVLRLTNGNNTKEPKTRVNSNSSYQNARRGGREKQQNIQ